MKKRDKQRIANLLLNHGLKQCLECGEEYTPSSGQSQQQKYCSKSCKSKVKSRNSQRRGEQWDADYSIRHGAKQCQECGKEYTPSCGQGKQQKYCSKYCKSKVKNRSIERKWRGGYSRYTYILLWLKARDEKDYTAPCHYCKKKLSPEIGYFVIEHKIPRSRLENTKEAMHDISNLVISCISCNELKGTNAYQTFKAEMAGDSELDVPEHKGEEHPLEKGEGVL
jgi:hypothetical protein